MWTLFIFSPKSRAYPNWNSSISLIDVSCCFIVLFDWESFEITDCHFNLIIAWGANDATQLCHKIELDPSLRDGLSFFECGWFTFHKMSPLHPWNTMRYISYMGHARYFPVYPLWSRLYLILNAIQTLRLNSSSQHDIQIPHHAIRHDILLHQANIEWSVHLIHLNALI